MVSTGTLSIHGGFSTSMSCQFPLYLYIYIYIYLLVIKYVYIIIYIYNYIYIYTYIFCPELEDEHIRALLSRLPIPRRCFLKGQLNSRVTRCMHLNHLDMVATWPGCHQTWLGNPQPNGCSNSKVICFSAYMICINIYIYICIRIICRKLSIAWLIIIWYYESQHPNQDEHQNG